MNEPKTIYLQVGDDYDPKEDNFKEFDVTWCTDQINENDLGFVAVSELAAKDTEIECLREAVDAAKEVVAARHTSRFLQAVDKLAAALEPQP